MMKQRNERKCVTKEELARLFDQAFSKWTASKRDANGSRQTPRVPVRGVKSIIVVSYAHQGKTVQLNSAARIVDISADGLGLLWKTPLPVGAQVHFEFGSRDDEGSRGAATVVRSTRQKGGYRTGLLFIDQAWTLDAVAPTSVAAKPSVPVQGWRGHLDLVKTALRHACRVLARRKDARREVRRYVDETEGLLVVEAKLFRYVASLYIDGRRAVRKTGSLDRSISRLFSASIPPTVINLEAGDFSAWATLQANAVTYCELDLTLQCKHRLCMNVLGAAWPRSQDKGRKKATPAAKKTRRRKTVAATAR